LAEGAPIRRRTRRAGVDLVFWEWPGGAPAALMLHGIANYGRYWDLFARAVGGRLRLVAPDARGHGDSGKPEARYEPREFVADAATILDAAGLDDAVVVGHSMGGTHALLLAAERPERVRALVLIDVGPEAMREGSERARRLVQGRPASFADRGEALAYLRETSPGYTDEVYANRLDHAFREQSGRLEWRSSQAALARISAARESSEALWDALRRLRCPRAIVRGTRSNTLAAATAERMVAERRAARPEDATELVKVDAGHNVALDRPAELADIVTALAARVVHR
jgi:pimeloyl-ACP methyl ester carboxylesterase